MAELKPTLTQPIEQYEKILNKLDYHQLLNIGMFWEFYPELTGVYHIDKQAIEEAIQYQFNQNIQREKEELDSLPKTSLYFEPDDIPEVNLKLEEKVVEAKTIKLIDVVEEVSKTLGEELEKAINLNTVENSEYKLPPIKDMPIMELMLIHGYLRSIPYPLNQTEKYRRKIEERMDYLILNAES